LQQSDSLGNRNLMKLYMNQSWWARKAARHERRKLLREARAHELQSFGMTVHGVRASGELNWL
jgi:hypothetical protein